MADERDEIRRVAWLALLLFVGGLMLPFAIAPLSFGLVGLPYQRAVNLAAGFGASCEVLALILGVVARRHLPGRIAGIGSGAVIALVAFATVVFVSR